MYGAKAKNGILLPGIAYRHHLKRIEGQMYRQKGIELSSVILSHDQTGYLRSKLIEEEEEAVVRR